MYFGSLIMLAFCLLWIGIVAFLRLKEGASVVYLAFFTIFYVYICKVLDYTILQFQSLLVLRYFIPGLILNGQAAEASMNLVPLVSLERQDVKTSLLNILLMIPFGFGLPFITTLQMGRVVVVGMLFSITIELLQFVTGWLAKITFRVADINDVIFNTLGVLIGYVLFVGFVRAYRHVSHDWGIPANPVLRFITERPQVDKQSS